MNPTDAVRAIPRRHLFLSETESQRERRSRFDKAALEELGKSLATTGQINPIVVRPVNEEKFEIVAGERRFLAAGLAKLDTVVCSVRELSDQQVLEVQLIENLQREDLHPLAEAEAYEGLRATMSVDEIASKVRRDASYVAKRMRLLALGKPARKAFYDGKISAAVAILLARIPVPKIQEEVLERYIDAADDWDSMTANDLQRLIESDYMTRLDTAPFDVKDPDLVKAAGPCGTCPKTTQNQGALFDDIKGKARCTDTVCFKAKVAAHSARLLAEATATGKQVISGKEAQKIAPHGASSMRGYVAISGHFYGKPVKKLLPKDYKPTLLQLPESGQVIEVAREKDLQLPAEARGDTAAADKHRAEQRAREQAHELERQVRQRLFQEIHAAQLEDQDHWLREACIGYFDNLSADTKQALAKAMGWKVKGDSTGISYARHFDLDPFLPADVPGLWKLLRALRLAGELSVSTWGDSQAKRLLAAAAAAGLDAKKVRAAVVAERSAAKKSKGKRKARA